METLRQRYRTALQSKFPGITYLGDNKFGIGDNLVFMIPLGLSKDPLLKTFNISKHMSEDYLAKIVVSDGELVKKLSSELYVNSGDLNDTLSALSMILTNKGKPFRSSKELIEISKALFHFSASPAKFAEQIVRTADKKILQQTMIEIDKLFKLIEQQVEKHT